MTTVTYTVPAISKKPEVGKVTMLYEQPDGRWLVNEADIVCKDKEILPAGTKFYICLSADGKFYTVTNGQSKWIIPKFENVHATA